MSHRKGFDVLGKEKNLLPLQEFELWTVQPVALSLNQVAIPAKNVNVMIKMAGSFSHL